MANRQTTTESEYFLSQLAEANKLRKYFALRFQEMAIALEQCEQDGKREKASGALGVEPEIRYLKAASAGLSEEVFRLLVLGEIKRGKTTFVNALIGEELLPTGVTPCTAMITIIKYGESPKVVIHFDDGNQEEIDFATFKKKYTIDPSEVKPKDTVDLNPFHQIEYAEVFYPMPLLQHGVEIIDSPGLNDTISRNRLSLNYVNNCHAVLFVMSAVQFLTLEEQSYLDDYIDDRGLTVFFVINQWDRIREGLFDPNDPVALKHQEKMVRDRAFVNLSDYCGSEDNFKKRVFEMKSLEAITRLQQKPPQTLDGTGFEKFLPELNRLLTKDRFKAEMYRATMIAREVFDRVSKTIDTRIPLLQQSEAEIQEQINQVEPKFQELEKIYHDFGDRIKQEKEQTTKEIEEDFVSFMSQLNKTFEDDFKSSYPELKLIDFLKKEKRKEFESEIKQAFVKYIAHKISIWSRKVEQDLYQTFEDLDRQASQYGLRYETISTEITELLTSKVAESFKTGDIQAEAATKSPLPAWAQWSQTTVSALKRELPASWLTLVNTDIDLPQIAMNIGTAIGVSAGLMMTLGAAITPLGAGLIGMGIGSWQLDRAKQALMSGLKNKFSDSLPIVTREQSLIVRQTVIEYFEAYENQVLLRIQNDILQHRGELQNLLAQQRQNVMNRDRETERLNGLRTYIWDRCIDLARKVDLLFVERKK